MMTPDRRVRRVLGFGDAALDPDAHSLTRVERFHEVRIAATVDRKRFGFDAFEVLERIRDAESHESVEWNDRTATFASCVGTPVLPGLAKRIFGLTEGDASLAAIRDALLMFAPGFIQVIAAQMDLYFEERARAREQGRPTSRGRRQSRRLLRGARRPDREGDLRHGRAGKRCRIRPHGSTRSKRAADCSRAARSFRAPARGRPSTTRSRSRTPQRASRACRLTSKAALLSEVCWPPTLNGP